MRAAELNQKIELWEMNDTTNSLGETDRTPEKIKDLWAKIIPRHGKTENIADTNTQKSVLNVIIRCRKLSVPNPRIDMFFMVKGVKYEIIDFIGDMKEKTFIEFSCRCIYE